MKLSKLLSIALLIGTPVLISNVQAKNGPAVSIYSETPAKTVIIKHPAANNIEGFFSTTTNLMFEVYKAGTKEDLAKIIAAIKKNSNVQDCVEGPLNGDYQAITLTLKEMKNKQWYAELFLKAGLNTIKINNNPIVEVGKM